jgi:hypothetical protein
MAWPLVQRASEAPSDLAKGTAHQNGKRPNGFPVPETVDDRRAQDNEDDDAGYDFGTFPFHGASSEDLFYSTWGGDGRDYCRGDREHGGGDFFRVRNDFYQGRDGCDRGRGLY